MKTNPRAGRAAFTLIELMAVITIIVILASLVVGGMGYVTDRQAREKAKVQIALLSKALEEYKADMGLYPQNGAVENIPEAGTGMTQRLYQALFYEGYEFSVNPARADSTTNPKATKIYLPDLDPTTTKQGWVTTSTGNPPAALPSPFLVDPWGNEYRYRKGTNARNPDFDLWSIGKDGDTNTANTSAGIKDKKNTDDIW